MRYLLVLAGLTALAVQAAAQEEKSIYKMLDSFTASSAAYNKCGANDAGLKSRFAANFMAVSTQAAMQAKEDHPFNPAADLMNAMDARGKAIGAKVEEEIAKQGCASEGIKELLRLYEADATWDMSAGKGQ